MSMAAVMPVIKEPAKVIQVIMEAAEAVMVATVVRVPVDQEVQAMTRSRIHPGSVVAVVALLGTGKPVEMVAAVSG